MQILTLLSIFVLGIGASFISTNVGGSALIITPMLIVLGLPPHVAIATARVASAGTMITGLYRFNMGRKVDYHVGFWAAGAALLGSFFGAHILLVTPGELLTKLIGVVMLLSLNLLWLGRLGIRPNVQALSKRHYLLGAISFFAIGLWGGFFGGHGVFSMYALVLIFHKTFLEAAGTRKLPGLAIVVVAVSIYALNGLVRWDYGMVLFFGSGIGSYLGAAYALRRGDVWVRGLFAFVVIALALKLLLVS